jgi:hypothetical protein
MDREIPTDSNAELRIDKVATCVFKMNLVNLRYEQLGKKKTAFLHPKFGIAIRRNFAT